jgi:phosphoglycerate-specific signal transduction histidine kinase
MPKTAAFLAISDRALIYTSIEPFRRLRSRLLDIAHLNRSATAGQLLASIAHEINQPLAAIAANGNAGLRWLNKEPPNLGEVRATLERIVGAVHRASKVVGKHPCNVQARQRG